MADQSQEGLFRTPSFSGASLGANRSFPSLSLPFPSPLLAPSLARMTSDPFQLSPPVERQATNTMSFQNPQVLLPSFNLERQTTNTGNNGAHLLSQFSGFLNSDPLNSNYYPSYTTGFPSFPPPPPRVPNLEAKQTSPSETQPPLLPPLPPTPSPASMISHLSFSPHPSPAMFDFAVPKTPPKPLAEETKSSPAAAKDEPQPPVTRKRRRKESEEKKEESIILPIASVPSERTESPSKLPKSQKEPRSTSTSRSQSYSVSAPISEDEQAVEGEETEEETVEPKKKKQKRKQSGIEDGKRRNKLGVVEYNLHFKLPDGTVAETDVLKYKDNGEKMQIRYVQVTGKIEASFVHAGDLGAPIVAGRRSNISREFGGFHSPSEKVIMSIPSSEGKRGHTSSVLTLAGVRRFLELPKLEKFPKFKEWITSILIPKMESTTKTPDLSSYCK